MDILAIYAQTYLQGSSFTSETCSGEAGILVFDLLDSCITGDSLHFSTLIKYNSSSYAMYLYPNNDCSGDPEDILSGDLNSCDKYEESLYAIFSISTSQDVPFTNAFQETYYNSCNDTSTIESVAIYNPSFCIPTSTNSYQYVTCNATHYTKREFVDSACSGSFTDVEIPMGDCSFSLQYGCYGVQE